MNGLGQRTIDARDPIARTQDVYRAVVGASATNTPASDPPLGPAPGTSNNGQTPPMGQGTGDSILGAGFYLGDYFIPYWLIAAGGLALWFFSGKRK